ncbi:Cytoskeleton-associated protein 2 [Dissostichus eleginoides]|uniref:Cytoskeleton-associated protein 2 n=1 Tax=Dissostichus eleginoides TaxID=100907 RepID=A0AAD9BG98_DISEL|nr:Cytoskeleton-associated protein 2 [Dissostichus eleginoides]
MENVAVSSRNHTNKKGNKENAQPAYGSKSFIRNDKPSVTPFQLTSNKRDDTLEKHGPLKAKVDTKSTSGEALQKVKPLQKTGRAAADVKPRQTHSRAYLSQQAGTSTQNSKISVTDKKVNKPPVSSTLSQYRFNMETAEERRAKLAEWMASKGKTFKRPARATAELSKTKVSAKPAADLKPKSQPAAQSKPEPRLEHKPDSAAAAHCADTQGAAPTHDRTPLIMNTTLDLLEDSDAGLPGDPQGSVDDIVLNLCDALDAMGTPSKCHEPSLVTDVSSDSEMEDSQPDDECKEEKLNKGTPEDVSKQPKVEQVKHQVEESDGVETEEEVESDDDVQCVTENTPQREGASMIKYSVKTTPYLQSVKKTIQEGASTSRSKKKNNIKDLKFLTPVRRSCRIERKSPWLPAMLMDPDPCVKNHALLEDLPDQPRL